MDSLLTHKHNIDNAFDAVSHGEGQRGDSLRCPAHLAGDQIGADDTSTQTSELHVSANSLDAA